MPAPITTTFTSAKFPAPGSHLPAVSSDGHGPPAPGRARGASSEGHVAEIEDVPGSSVRTLQDVCRLRAQQVQWRQQERGDRDCPGTPRSKPITCPASSSGRRRSTQITDRRRRRGPARSRSVPTPKWIERNVGSAQAGRCSLRMRHRVFTVVRARQLTRPGVERLHRLNAGIDLRAEIVSHPSVDRSVHTGRCHTAGCAYMKAFVPRA